MDLETSRPASLTPSTAEDAPALCPRCHASVRSSELAELDGLLQCLACRAHAMAKVEETGLLEAAPPGASPTSATDHGLLASCRENAREWCAGRSWLPRTPLYALMAYWAVRHVTDTTYAGVIRGLNFGLHELGHVLFGFGGMFVAIAGGTLLQCAAPLVGGWMFFKQRDWFAIAFAFTWLGTNLFDVARYAGDARTRSLPLVGLGAGEPIHDWHYMLSKLGLLDFDDALAAGMRLGGGACFALGLGLGGWLLWQMIRPAR